MQSCARAERFPGRRLDGALSCSAVRVGRRLSGWLLIATQALACSPQGAPLAIPAGATPLAAAPRPGAPPQARRIEVAPEPALPPWDLTAALPTLRRATPRAASEHLTGAFEGEVLVSEGAKAYPALGPQRQLLPGATLVERQMARGAEATAVYFVMVKRPPGFDPAGGDWEYLLVTPEGLVEQRGRLPLCGRCHADAPHDHIFGAGR